MIVNDADGKLLYEDPRIILSEQALASVWSLKHFNDCHVTVVTDEESHQLMLTGWRKQYAELFDEILPFHFDESTSKMERSRQLKTTLRQLIKGNFLFIDTDTIITGDLSEIDTLTCDIAMVEDMNCAFMLHPHYKEIIVRNSRIFDLNNAEQTSYYNSGVIYVRDSETSELFFQTWNRLWSLGKRKQMFLDQPALYETCKELPDVVESLSGVYNCQVVINVSYMINAKILHFFNSKDKKNVIHPMLDGSFYRQIKSDRGLANYTQGDILNCRSLFSSPIMLAPGDDILAWHSRSFDLLRYLQKRHRKTANVLDIIANNILKLLCKED